MPYKIQKRGSKWCLVRRDGTVKSRHTSKAKAEKADRVIRAKSTDGSPRNKEGKGRKGDIIDNFKSGFDNQSQ